MIMVRVHAVVSLIIASGVCGLSFSDRRSGLLAKVTEFNDKLVTTQTNVVDKREDVGSLILCAMLCFDTETCGSFFYVKTSKLCQLHSVLFVDVTDAVDAPGSVYFQVTEDWCPHDIGYVVYRPLDLCYKSHKEEKKHAEAEAVCENEGGTLAMVKNETIFSHLYDFLRASSSLRLTHFQMGADDIEVQGQLRWPDNSSVTWTNWAEGEPSHDSERCTALAWFYYFKWNDIPCDYLFSFLCQIVKP